VRGDRPLRGPPVTDHAGLAHAVTTLRGRAVLREALVAFDPATGRGIAVARYAPVPGAPRVADVAVTVADEWQGRGLGTALLARLVARAAAEGHIALRASVLSVNRASIALLRRAGFRLRENGGTLLELELDLRLAPAATARARATGAL